MARQVVDFCDSCHGSRAQDANTWYMVVPSKFGASIHHFGSATHLVDDARLACGHECMSKLLAEVLEKTHA